jgi:hypothetical protein
MHKASLGAKPYVVDIPLLERKRRIETLRSLRSEQAEKRVEITV